MTKITKILHNINLLAIALIIVFINRYFNDSNCVIPGASTPCSWPSNELTDQPGSGGDNPFCALRHYTSIAMTVTVWPLPPWSWQFNERSDQPGVCWNYPSCALRNMYIRQATHKIFKIRLEGSPYHTPNTSMSAHEWARLGFNIIQLSPKVTNSNMTRVCIKVQVGNNNTAKLVFFFSSAFRSDEDCISQT